MYFLESPDYTKAPSTQPSKSNNNQSLRIEYDSEKISKPIKVCFKWISKRPRWLWIMILTSLGIVSIASIISVSLILTYNSPTLNLPNYQSNNTIGRQCTSTSNCIVNSYCLISSTSTSRIGICACVNTHYFDSTSSSCLQRKTQSQPCSFTYECQETLSCILGICQCESSTKFWNSTVLECQNKKQPLAVCQTGWADCLANSACTNTWPLNIFGIQRCICTGGWWFNTNSGMCELRKVVGATCTVDSECTTNAYCATISSVKVCVCDSFYFNNNGQCSQKSQNNGAGCSFIDQCNLVQNNLRCISSTCRCDPSTEVFDTFLGRCISLKKYGETCTSTSNCLNGYNMVCAAPSAISSRLACICSSIMYYDVVSGSCVTRKLNNVQCNSRLECNNPDLMICVSNGGLTKRCQCIPNISYLNTATNTCAQKKSRLSTCSSDAECQDYLGMICLNGICNCPSTKYYDSPSKQCLWLKRNRDTCTSNTQCASNNCCSTQYCC